MPDELRKAYLATALTIFVWASAFPGIAYCLRYFEAGHLVLFRFLVASLSLAAYVALRGGLRRPEARDLPRMLALGVLGITVYHVCLAFGQRHVPAGTASLIIATVPVWTALLGRALGRERLKPIGWAGVAISFAGVGLIVLSRSGEVSFSLSAGLVIISAVATSLLYVFQGPLVKKFGAIGWTIYCVWIGTLPLLLFAPGLGSAVANAPWSAIAAVAYIGSLPVYCYISWNYALERLAPTFTTSFLNISPIFAFVIAWVWVGEVPGVLTVVGGGVAIAGVLLLNLIGRRRG